MLNTTVSHISPLLSYIPRTSWFEGNQSDPELSQYSNQSYHYSDSPASVIFSWWGTSIWYVIPPPRPPVARHYAVADTWVFGGYRNWTGGYQVSVDNQGVQNFPGYTGGKEEFQHLLYANDSLFYGYHQIRITNGGGDGPQSVLDIDYLVYETTQNDGGEISHNDPGCDWSPASPNFWQVDETSHTTNNTSGAMELSFAVCTGIILYGYLDATSAPLTVSVDGWAFRAAAPNTAIAPILPNVTHVLFTQANLPVGQHTMRVENNPLGLEGTGAKMNIAFSRVLSPASPALDPTQSTPSPSTSSTAGDMQDPRHVIVLAICFSTLGAFLLSLFIWRLVVYYRIRQKMRKEKFFARPFYARTNLSSPPPSPQSRYSIGVNRTPRWRRNREGDKGEVGDIATLQRTRRGHGRRPVPPSDIQFAHSQMSSQGHSDERHAHWRSRSYDDRVSYADEDELLAYSHRYGLHSPQESLSGSSVSTSPTVVRERESLSFSMHVNPTAPSSPAEDSRVRPPLHVNKHTPSDNLTSNASTDNHRPEREHTRRPRHSTEKPPLELVAQQLAVLESSARARRAETRFVGSPVVSLPTSTSVSSRPSTGIGTGTGIGTFTRPLPQPPLPLPPVPPIPMHLRPAAAANGSSCPQQDEIYLGEGMVGLQHPLGLPPPYRLLDLQSPRRTSAAAHT